LTELLSHSASRRRLFMKDRPKSNVELANEMLSKSNPPEMLKRREEENPSLASLLRGRDIDVSKRPK
jgi:hypothetical protein